MSVFCILFSVLLQGELSLKNEIYSIDYGIRNLSNKEKLDKTYIIIKASENLSQVVVSSKGIDDKTSLEGKEDKTTSLFMGTYEQLKVILLRKHREIQIQALLDVTQRD